MQQPVSHDRSGCALCNELIHFQKCVNLIVCVLIFFKILRWSLFVCVCALAEKVCCLFFFFNK